MNQPAPINPINKPIQSIPGAKKDWTTMSKEEREADKVRRLTAAKAAVGTGEFPKGVRFKVGEHTLTALPSGVSEKGSVAYSATPSMIRLVGSDGKIYSARLNKFSLSIMAENGMESLAEDGADFI